MDDNELTVKSHPVEWVNAFYPVYKPDPKSNNKTPYTSSIDQIRKWSNKKVTMMGMGTQQLYPSFTAFTTPEFEQYLYLFFWNGLNPSSRL